MFIHRKGIRDVDYISLDRNCLGMLWFLGVGRYCGDFMNVAIAGIAGLTLIAVGVMGFLGLTQLASVTMLMLVGLIVLVYIL